MIAAPDDRYGYRAFFSNADAGRSGLLKIMNEQSNSC